MEKIIYNGFESQQEYEKILNYLKEGIEAYNLDDDWDGERDEENYVHTYMVRKEGDTIKVYLNDEAFDVDYCTVDSKDAVDMYNGLKADEPHYEEMHKTGEYDDYLNNTDTARFFPFGGVCDIKDGKIVIGVDAGLWSIPFTKEAIADEFISEQILNVCEEMSRFLKN